MGDKVTLRPELLSDQSHRRDAQVGKVDAVTHGAGSAGSSVPVGCDNADAVATNLTQQLLIGSD